MKLSTSFIKVKLMPLTTLLQRISLQYLSNCKYNFRLRFRASLLSKNVEKIRNQRALNELWYQLKDPLIQIDPHLRLSQYWDNVVHFSQATSTGKSRTSLKHGWFHGLHSQALLQSVHSFDAILNSTQRVTYTIFYTRRDKVHIILNLT